ncbi:MAG: helix-turn-helix transcriptional regulator [Candidatus Didemnitutus sp.]|nr:helix-turn-helix transcriptional regulator [Candidatus Didemnitutus sp.]
MQYAEQDSREVIFCSDCARRHKSARAISFILSQPMRGHASATKQMQNPLLPQEVDGVPELTSGRRFVFILQPACSVPEQRLAHPVALITLAPATALFSWQGDQKPRRHPVRAEKIWLMPAGHPHAITWHQPVPVLRLVLPPGALSATHLFRLVDLTRIDWDAAEAINSLRPHFKQPELAPADFVEKQCKIIAGQLMAALQRPRARLGTSGLVAERFRRITDQIEDKLDEDFTREQLAAIAGISEHHFSRMFTQRTGLSLREYIALRRCFRARPLIPTGMPLVQVAQSVGFKDQSAMCKKFLLFFGRAPSTFA